MSNDLTIINQNIETIPAINLEYFLEEENEEEIFIPGMTGRQHIWRGKFPVRQHPCYVELGKYEFEAGDSGFVELIKALVDQWGGSKDVSDVSSSYIEFGLDKELPFGQKLKVSHALKHDWFECSRQITGHFRDNIKELTAAAVQKIFPKLKWEPRPGQEHLVGLYQTILSEVKEKYHLP